MLRKRQESGFNFQKTFLQQELQSKRERIAVIKAQYKSQNKK
jgi:hypothetical protein